MTWCVCVGGWVCVCVCVCVCVYRYAITTSEATCDECLHQTSSKTNIQIVNKPEVRLHKMDWKLSAGNITC